MNKSNQAEERQITETVLSYCESGGTHLQPGVMKIPVVEYTDPDQLRREIDILFRQFPIIVGHISQLPAPGTFFTHNATGVPMLITRNRDGAVKAFLNVCRHRGARVEQQACGKANTFSCPYHSWTYDLDGNLRGLPKDANFGDIDKSELGLVELPSFERHGLIWVRPSNSATPVDIDAWLAPMANQLESLDLQSHLVFKEWVVPREMNWHIALEGFQEQYHFCSAHKNTACAGYLDNQGVFLNQYPHVRHAVPLTGIEKLRDQPSDEWSYRKNFMTQNYLFPCNFVQVMPDHVYIHTIIPTGQTSCIFQCLMLIPETADTEKAQKYWQANYNVVRQVFDEDFVIGEGIQAGLNAGANEHFTIGRFESGLQMARQSLNDALAGRLRV
jgi:phenylpropionate dioxygenase-like ring-hydroxylating dioxygenase large terminal subunit